MNFPTSNNTLFIRQRLTVLVTLANMAVPALQHFGMSNAELPWVNIAAFSLAAIQRRSQATPGSIAPRQRGGSA
jgi:hypothetical protein